MAVRGTGYRQVRVYTIYKPRFIRFIILVLLTVAAAVYLIDLAGRPSQYMPGEIPADALAIYFETGRAEDVPWYHLAAIDRAEGIPFDQVSRERALTVALWLTGIKSDDELPGLLQDYNDDTAFIKRVVKEARRFRSLNDIYENKVFPIPAEYAYSFEDGFGDKRTFGGERTHEGTDIMAEKGVPVLSVGDGVVEQVGWNMLGGWRIGIRGNDGVYYYYAHLSSYEGLLKRGHRIKKGQVIGYVGDSGYGPEGTTGEFEPHLHFGMYTGKDKSLRAFNPYPFLLAWNDFRWQN